MTERTSSSLPFNSPFETGMRSVGVLVAAYPMKFDLQRLVGFDHLVVHTGDVGGPESLHPALPMRSSELLVRRGLVERGLLLMLSRGLVQRFAEAEGIVFQAGEFADTFLSSLSSPYLGALRDRAQWIVQEFAYLGDEEFSERMSSFFDQWIEQFQVAQQSLASE